MADKIDIERLFKANYELLYRRAVALIHDDDIARDIVHDVFASLLNNDLNVIITPGYLYRAVTHRALNYIRDTELHNRITNDYFLDIDDTEVDEEHVADEDTLNQIYEIIRSDLPERCREVIDLRFEGEMPFALVAREMGISESAVFKHLRKALLIIRKKLGNNG